MAGDVWLVAGLGNPGSEYDGTRHNVGFAVADLLASRLDARFKSASKHRSLVAETRDGDARVVLAKPQTYMNVSGDAIGSLARFHRVEPGNVVVVYDDLDLAFAALRVRLGGGTAGHNGLKSIVGAIGSEFVRVRIGIGRPPGRIDPADHVLSRFSATERPDVEVAIERAADAVLAVIRDGVAAAQNIFN